MISNLSGNLSASLLKGSAAPGRGEVLLKRPTESVQLDKIPHAGIIGSWIRY
jgi:hypothetical protein